MKKNSKSTVETKLKTSVFNQFSVNNKMGMESEIQSESSNQMLSESLFNLDLSSEEDSSQDDKNPLKTLLEPALKNYFYILDITNTGLLSFNNFLNFVKYLRLWDKLNIKNLDPRGILNSNSINGNFFPKFFLYLILKFNILVLSFVNIQPKLSLSENERLQNMDLFNCKYIDFLIFIDYMISPKIFKPLLEKINFNLVNEMNLQLGLRKLNLYMDIKNKNLIFQMGSFMKNFDYEAAVNLYY